MSCDVSLTQLPEGSLPAAESSRRSPKEESRREVRAMAVGDGNRVMLLTNVVH